MYILVSVRQSLSDLHIRRGLFLSIMILNTPKCGRIIKHAARSPTGARNLMELYNAVEIVEKAPTSDTHVVVCVNVQWKKRKKEKLM